MVIRNHNTAFTLVEILLASIVSVLILFTLCMAYQYATNRWDVITSKGYAMGTVNTALERIQKDAKNAVSFKTAIVSGNTLYIFTLPNNTSSGQYIPQRVGTALQYVSGPQVCFYLSDITGSQSVANGTVLWRGTAPAGSSTYTADSSWSLVNTGAARCDNIKTFNITTSGMPQNTVQVNLSINGSSGHQSSTYTISRNLYMSDTNTASSPPTNLMATGSSSTVSLSWTTVGGASSYNIYRGTSSKGEGATPYVTGWTLAYYTDSNVTSGNTYYYYVTAVNGTESSYSNEASATVTTASYVTVTPSVSNLSIWWGEEDLTITSSQTITAFSSTVVVANTPGLSYYGNWNSFWNSVAYQSYLSKPITLTYYTDMYSGQTQQATTVVVANQFNLIGLPHPTIGDTYTVKITSGGIAQTFTGHF